MTFQTAIRELVKSNCECACLRNRQKQFEEVQAISDDYYDVANCNFVISEYERCLLDRKTCQLKMADDKDNLEK